MTLRNRRLREAGFTLIEMLVVIAVLGLVLGLLATYGPFRDRWVQTQGFAAKIAAAMNQDRGLAIAGGRPVPLILPALPDWLTATVAAPPGGIVFQPDGSVMGGQVTLAEGGRKILVGADWLTGRVHVDAP